MIITHTQLILFFLIFARLVGLLFFAPIYSRREFFTVARVAFLFWVAGLFLFIIPLPEVGPTGFSFILALVIELLIGLLIGFVMDAIITGLEFAGTIVDTQSSLGGSAILDPSSGTSVTVFTVILKWTATMMFFIIDGHHMVLAAIINSFTIMPVGTVPNITSGVEYALTVGTTIFYIATVFSASIALVMFLIDFGFGILNKIAEQVNVFSIAFQVKPSVTISVFVGMTPALIYGVQRILEDISEDLLELFLALQV